MNSFDRILGVVATPEPNWQTVRAQLSQAPDIIADIPREVLLAVVNILSAPGHWQQVNSVGQWDPETQVRHIRSEDLQAWNMPLTLEIRGQDVYALVKGENAPRLGTGIHMRFCCAVKLNDLSLIAKGSAKLQNIRLDPPHDNMCMPEREVRLAMAHRVAAERDFRGCPVMVQTFFTNVYPAKPSKGVYQKLGIAAQYCNGGELLRLMKDREHPFRDLFDNNHNNVFRIIRDCLEMLALLEVRRYVHRDIKPENILVYLSAPGELRAKLGDLGFARTIASEKERLANLNHKLPGSLTHAAPEVLWLDPKAERTPQLVDSLCSPKTDVWSMGVVLYELLCDSLLNCGMNITVPNSFTQANIDEGFANWGSREQGLVPCLVQKPETVAFLNGLVHCMLRIDPEARSLGSELLDEFDAKIAF